MRDAKNKFYLNAMGLCCCLGADKETVSRAIFLPHDNNGTLSRYLQSENHYLADGGEYNIGRVKGDLPAIPDPLKQYQSRNNQMLLSVCLQIRDEISQAIDAYGHNGIAVILGSSTSGIADGEEALFSREDTGHFPNGYKFDVQEIADGSEFVAEFFGLSNMAVTISTACSSSAKVFEHAAEFMKAGICDAAIVGGVDSLCHMTVNGFHSLGALSAQRCNPFSRNRSGISIGEGGALFLMTRKESLVQLVSIGESSDGYSMTAPEPNGDGAENSMRAALARGGVDKSAIAYVNLHGTGTTHNDSMESKAVSRVFGHAIPCSSSKSFVGHTLGAAGAVETALCWLMLNDDYNPERFLLPHIWDRQPDDDVALVNFVKPGDRYNGDNIYVLSNFCAFGGSNASVLLKRGGHNDGLRS